MQHDERVFDAPVGCVGHVRDALQAVERDVVLARVAAERALHAPAQRRRFRKPFGEAVDGAARGIEQPADFAVAVRIVRGITRAPLIDRVEPVMQRVDEQLAPPGVVQQIVLQIGIALDDPDVAQHLEQHSRRAAGAALAAKILEQRHIGAPRSRITISRSENDV
jgi:hypothetical protein